MAEHIFETLAAEFREHLPHHHASAETPAATATIEPAPQEDPVISLAEVKTDLAAFAAKLEEIDEDAVTKVAAIKATPEGAGAFEALAALAAATGTTGVLKTAGNVLAAIGELAPQPAAEQPQEPAQPSFTPAGPQVGGQA